MQVASGILLATGISLVSVVIAGRLAFVSSLIIVLVLGLLAKRATVLAWASPGMKMAASRLIRIGIVLIGLRISLGDLASIGLPGLVVALLTVTLTVHSAQWLGRRLGYRRTSRCLSARATPYAEFLRSRP